MQLEQSPEMEYGMVEYGMVECGMVEYTPMGILSPLHSTKYKVAYEAGAQELYRICVLPSLTTGLHDV